MIKIDETHNPKLSSWVDSANTADTDFPIQNLPFGRFRQRTGSPWRIGVAIGDYVLDLHNTGLLNSIDISHLLGLDSSARRALRQHISAGLAKGSQLAGFWENFLLPMSDVQLGLPCEIPDYTDFYVGIHHATAVGKLFRPDNPLLPNYEWVPIGYHGRASTIRVSGTDFHRPKGQFMTPGAIAPVVEPTKRLDFELELGFVIGAANSLGQSIHINAAEDHVFGVALFNDWSARDLQAWEYQPLGPFLSKNFASTLSPWTVTLEALAPFRAPLQRPSGYADPMPYLESDANWRFGALDIDLQVLLQTQAMREAGTAAEGISRSNSADASFWTLAQLVAHHTVNGCLLSPGDLFGSGTLSGPRPDQAGSLLELTLGGKEPLILSNGQKRTFLEDGDCITLRGRCERSGFRSIGFGECSATVQPAI